MNFHQTPEEIIKNATAEQRILWNYVFMQFGDKVGISQFYYNSLNIGELGVYDARKMYLALKLCVGHLGGNIGGGPRAIDLYDETNTANQYLCASDSYWDVTGAQVRTFNIVIEWRTLLFSRFVSTGNAFQFIGYRLAI
jgi:hypothetical protein